MECLNSVIDNLRPFLKASNYKKRNLTWIKDTDQLVIIFAIHKSQFGTSKWYYEFGIGLKEISSKNITSINSCHIYYQIENMVSGKEVSADMLIELIKKWESMYGNIEKLRLSALKGNLPPLSNRSAVTYLTTVDLSQL